MEVMEIRKSAILKNRQNRPAPILAYSDTKTGEFSKYERSDSSLFRSAETLPQKAGVPLRAIPKLVMKELADNALDASRAVELTRSGSRFIVENPPPGISGSPEDIAETFSFGRPLLTTKLLRLPTRGMLGNGTRVVAGAVLVGRGTLTVTTAGREHFLRPLDDGTTQCEWQQSSEDADGTRVEIDFGELPIDDDPMEWARIAQGFIGYGKSYTGRTSAHWYDADALFELFQAAKSQTVRALVEQFDGLSGSKAATVIDSDMRSRPASELSREEVADLLERMQDATKPVKHTRLGYVGREYLSGAGYSRLNGSFETGSRTPATIPVIVECWVHPANDDDITICVNRSPVASTDIAIHRQDDKLHIGLFGCGLRHKIKVKRSAANIVLHITSPMLPLTSDGKSPDLKPLATVISESIESAARRMPSASRNRASSTSQKDAVFQCLPKAIDHCSSGGTHAFTLRNLYYMVRPALLEKGLSLSYGWFGGIITDWESEHGSIRGMYRDDRGTIYHPHTGEEIPLGTLAVEQYERPAWTFNKVLFVEKEGIVGVLRAEGWPEQNDCAVFSSKGQPTRAARDLIDTLGRNRTESLTVYAMHDADAAGTIIFQSLQGATKARAARKVKIIDIGLDPSEAINMGLPVEPVKRKKGRSLPVASSVTADWAEWYQSNRIELNAMTTPQLLEWLSSKITPTKVIPPKPVLSRSLTNATREIITEHMTATAIREARVEERVDATMKTLKPKLTAEADGLRSIVEKALARSPKSKWTTPVQEAARNLAAQ